MSRIPSLPEMIGTVLCYGLSLAGLVCIAIGGGLLGVRLITLALAGSAC